MSEVAGRMVDLERRVCAHDEDIRFIYVELKEHRTILRDHSRLLRDHSRELRWLRSGVTALLTHAGLEPPTDEPAEEEE